MRPQGPLLEALLRHYSYLFRSFSSFGDLFAKDGDLSGTRVLKVEILRILTHPISRRVPLFWDCWLPFRNAVPVCVFVLLLGAPMYEKVVAFRLHEAKLQ